MRDPCLQTQETVRASLNSSDPAVMLDQSSMGEFHIFYDNPYSKSGIYLVSAAVVFPISQLKGNCGEKKKFCKHHK